MKAYSYIDNFEVLSGKTIVIAELDIIKQKIFELLFRDTDVKLVFHFGSKEAVIRVANEVKTDLIILGLCSPDLIVTDAMDYIRELNPRIPIMIFGNFNYLYSPEYFYQRGAAYCFSYPFQADTFMKKLIGILYKNAGYKIW